MLHYCELCTFSLPCLDPCARSTVFAWCCGLAVRVLWPCSVQYICPVVPARWVLKSHVTNEHTPPARKRGKKLSKSPRRQATRATDPSPKQKPRHRRRREPPQPLETRPASGHVTALGGERPRPAMGSHQLTRHQESPNVWPQSHPGPKPPSPPTCAAMATSIMPAGAKSSWPPSP